MTNEQLIAKFNPANGANVSAEDQLEMQNFTDEQIQILAKAYPNQPQRRSYIRLYDKTLPANKQLFQLSTWQNLNNLRKYSNKKNLVAYDFLTIKTKQQPRPIAGKPTAPKRVVVDLTAQEAAAELTKAIQNQKVKAVPIDNKTPESFTEKMAKAKADKKAAQLAGKIEPATNKDLTQKTGIPADQDFDAGAD